MNGHNSADSDEKTGKFPESGTDFGKISQVMRVVSEDLSMSSSTLMKTNICLNVRR